MEVCIRDFVRSFSVRWFVKMSGGLGVPLTISSYFVDGYAAKSILFLTGVVCAVFSSYWIWNVERISRLDAEAKIRAIEGADQTYNGPAFYSLQEAFDFSYYSDESIFLAKLRDHCGLGIIPSLGRKNGNHAPLEPISNHIWASYRMDFEWGGRAVPDDPDLFSLGQILSRLLYRNSNSATYRGRYLRLTLWKLPMMPRFKRDQKPSMV